MLRGAIRHQLRCITILSVVLCIDGFAESVDHSISATSITASGHVDAPRGASRLVRRAGRHHQLNASQHRLNTTRHTQKVVDGSDADAMKLGSKLAMQVRHKEETSNHTARGSSFRLEFRSTAFSLVMLEASCLFLSGPHARESGNDAEIQTQQTVLQPLALQPLRFLGIAMIVFHHEAAFWKVQHEDYFEDLWLFFQHFAHWGDCLVQFFLALSGFVLYLSQKGAPKVPSITGFIWKRFSSIYPAYIASILLGIAADKDPRKMFSIYVDGHDLPGFLMIDSWAVPYLYSPNLPAWFLCSIFFSWLCFPRWYRFIRHVRAPHRALLVAWLSTFALPMLHTARWLHRTWDEPGGGSPPTAFAYWHPLANWQPFVFGMCLARLATEIEAHRLPSSVRQVSASVALAVLAAIFFFGPRPPPMTITPDDPTPDLTPNPLYMFCYKGPFLLPIFAVLLVFTSIGEDRLLQPLILQKPWCLWLGSMSAELYMFHCPVRLMVHRFIENPSSLLTFCTQFAVAAAVNALTRQLWEVSKWCSCHSSFLAPWRKFGVAEVRSERDKM